MDTFAQISVQKAHEIIGSVKVNIVDIRDSASFAQGHLPQAKMVNDENIEIFVKEADKKIPLICYCYHGISSRQAASYFAQQGFKQVYSIDGGWEEWKAIYG